jgi:hypothetical protein
MRSLIEKSFNIKTIKQTNIKVLSKLQTTSKIKSTLSKSINIEVKIQFARSI